MHELGSAKGGAREILVDLGDEHSGDEESEPPLTMIDTRPKQAAPEQQKPGEAPRIFEDIVS